MNEAESEPAVFSAALEAEREGDISRACALFDEAVAHGALAAAQYQTIADANMRLKRPLRALAALNEYVALRPREAGGYVRAAQILALIGQRKNALANFKQALQIEPRSVEIWTAYGACLSADNQVLASLSAFQTALKYNPQSPGLLSNCGWLLCQLQRFEESLEHLNRALALAPQHPGARWNRALCLLTMGRFEQGLEDYEARMAIDDARYERLRRYDAPLWHKGEAVAGKRVFLYTDQGNGDTIQFIRLARELLKLDAQPIVEVQPALADLCRTLHSNVQIVTQGSPPPPFDLYCPLPSLPHRLGLTLETIPARVPYLHADAAQTEAWRERLAGLKGRLKTGIVWAGNPQHFNDANRSIRLQEFLPLLECSGIAFVNLQKEMSSFQRQLIAAHGVPDFTAGLKSFADTAALVAALDLVISVDTSVAHLAGALGKPVWILLPFAVDFRWLSQRTDSPWYPTARLFRQPKQEDWPSAISTLRAALVAASR